MESYLLVLAGAVFSVAGLILPSKQAALKKKGKKAAGVIFDFNGSPAPFDSSDSSINDSECARVRFVTEQLEWITEDVRNGLGFQLKSNYKAGEKVTVYYDPANPTSFSLDSGVPETVIRAIIMIAGLIMAGAGVYAIMTNSGQIDN